MLDFDMMPPDWTFAKQHAKASKPGIARNIQTQKTTNVYCPCCLKPVVKDNIPLWSNSKELEFLGFGFPLYFIFLKYCIVLILVLIVTYSSMSLYWGAQNNAHFCSHQRLSSEEDVHCTSFMVMLARIEQHPVDEQIVMRIVCFIAHILALIYIRDAIRKTYEYYDEKTTSLSDYSIIIKNLPMKSGIQQNIKDFIHNHFKQNWSVLKQTYDNKQVQQDKKVMQITLLPNIKDYYELVAQKQVLIEQKRKKLIAIDKQQSSKNKNAKNIQILQQSIEQINQQIEKQNQKIHLKCQKYKLLASEDQLTTQKAIVVLNSQLFKNVVLQQSNDLTSQNVGQYFGQFQGQINVLQAPQPNQIIWANANYSTQQRLIGRLTGWGLTVLFIAVITVGFYFLVVLKTKNLINAIQHSTSVAQLHHDSEYIIAVFVVYLALILIVLFNKLICGIALNYFTYLEKHETTAGQQFSFAIKYTISMFFTTALMTLAVEDITFHNFYQHEYGVIEEESVMFLINAFFVPLIWLINPEQIQILIQRKLSENKPYFTQQQANKIMSNSNYKMGKRYAQIIKTMWFTFLYGTLIPGGAFVTLVGLSIYYWIDKYNLLRQSSVKGNISGKMALVSMKLLDISVFLMPIGSIIFDSQMRDGVHPSTIVLACVGFVYLFLPIDDILGWLHDEKFKQEQKSYETTKDTFLQTYQTLNPILSFKINKVFENLQRKLGRKISLGVFDLSHNTMRTLKTLPPLKNVNNTIDLSSQFDIKINRKNDRLNDSGANTKQIKIQSQHTLINLLQNSNTTNNE